MRELPDRNDQLLRQIAGRLLAHRQELLGEPEVKGRALFYTISWRKELKGYDLKSRPLNTNPQEVADCTKNGTRMVITKGPLAGLEATILLDVDPQAMIDAITAILSRAVSTWNNRACFVFTPPGVKPVRAASTTA
jgi:hypothetical protein